MISYLEKMVELGASDIFFSANAKVNVKVEGDLSALEADPLPAEDVKNLIYSVLSESQIETFEKTLELNLAIARPELGRFRINVYRQRGEVSAVARHIPHQIPSLEQLNLPDTLEKISLLPRGLVLVVGSTGSGKSTALASMIKYRSDQMSGHILTIEEPIEFVHQHSKSLVEQREVGTDTLSYEAALKNAMREAPDVIMIGEIRDRETMQSAIAYAETGHLCISTLHANNANQALDRIINFFPESAHPQLLLDLSHNLESIVSLRLLRGLDGKRLPAYEILLKSPYISDLIEERKVDEIKEVMARGMIDGMITFDQSVFNLYSRKKISAETALANADSETNLRAKIKLENATFADESSLELKK